LAFCLAFQIRHHENQSFDFWIFIPYLWKRIHFDTEIIQKKVKDYE